jgi:hypothetical protein
MTPRTLVLPKLGLTMTEGTIVEWQVGEGRRFAAGDTLSVIENDKAATELVSEENGVLDRILVNAGESAPVGAVLAEWHDDGVSSGQVSPPGDNDPDVLVRRNRRASEAMAAEIAPPRSARSATGQGGEAAGRLRISPYARRLALRHGVSPLELKGTGPAGRVKAADVERARARTESLRHDRAAGAPEKIPLQQPVRVMRPFVLAADLAFDADRRMAGFAPGAGLSSWILMAAGHALGFYEPLRRLVFITGNARIEVPRGACRIAALQAALQSGGRDAAVDDALAVLDIPREGIRYLIAPPAGGFWAQLTAARADGNLSLQLSADIARISPDAASNLLLAIKSRLEDPCLMLL